MSRSADEREAARLERERAARDARGEAPPEPPPAEPELAGAGAGRQRRRAAAAGAAARGAIRPGRGTRAEPEPRAGAEPPPMRSVPERAPASTGIPTTSRSARSRAPQPGAPGMSPHRPVDRAAGAAGGPGAGCCIAAPLALLADLRRLRSRGRRSRRTKGDGSGEVAVVIPQGASTREIGDLLADKGVVGSGFFFALRAGIGGDDLRAGRFTLRRDMGNAEAIDGADAVPGGAEADPADAARGPLAPRDRARASRAPGSRATTCRPRSARRG